MKIIDKHENLREKFCNLPEGVVFKINDRYYMKVEAMFFYSDIDNLIEERDICYIEDIEAGCPIINAIRLDNSAYYCYCYFNDDTLVEPLKTELHIV